MADTTANQNQGPRKHHYVPAFLLQGFTPSGQRDDFLWVHDRQQQGKSWRVKPDQAAHERDYYRVEVDPDVDPNIVEKMFGETIETRTAALIQEMGRTHALPGGEDFEALIEFVTLLAIRTPSFRSLYERNMEHVYRHQAKMFFSDRRIFDQFVEDQRQQGNELPADVTYEGLRDFIFDDDSYTIAIPRTQSVQMLLDMWQHLIPFFQARKWSLFFTSPENAHLICSDMPVSITPTSPDFKSPFIGFGIDQTELTVPLSRSLVLIGSYESSSMTAEIPLLMVREANKRTRSLAERFLYSAEKNILI